MPRPRPRTFLARQAVRLAERWTGRTFLAIEHPPSELRPRYGYGRPPHAGLVEILGRADDAYRRNLETILEYKDALLKIAVQPSADPIPTWLNRWLLGLDSAAIYSFMRSRNPRAYVEVGSGMSTLFARRAVEDGERSTVLTSIDPHPRVDIDRICDRALRQPLEQADLSLFQDLREGDVMFVDGSHHVFTNSDATVFFLDVLPALPAGVLVGVHDMLLPDDYLPMWTEYHWSEQYLMAAYLLAEGAKIRLELASSYVTGHSDLHRILDPLWSTPQLAPVDPRGFTLWFTTVNR